MIKILDCNKDIKSFIFPGGEEQIKVPLNIRKFPINIIARIENSSELMQLLFVVNALKNLYGQDCLGKLTLGYIPYAQQDRVCAEGEALSIKVFANLINDLQFKKVIVVDPHSDVSTALINNTEIISVAHVVEEILNKYSNLYDTIIISPDAGSNKKMISICQVFGHSNFISADKIRDCKTGEITETIVYCDDFLNRNVTIIDDICIGGRTFIELAKILKNKNCGKINLCITHGIFSQGVKHLLENGIDNIYTTNTRMLNGQNASFIDNQLHITKII